MSLYLRRIFNFIRNHRKNFFILILLSLLIVLVRFPWSEGTEKLVRDIKSKMSLPINVDFKEVSLNLFSPGISFYDLQLSNKSFSDVLEIDTLKISLALSKWLALHPGYNIKVEKDRSQFFTSYWKKKKKVNKIKETYIYLTGFAPFLNLKDFKSLSKGIHAEGSVVLKFSFNFDKNNLNTLEGVLSGEGSSIQFQKFQINTNMGPFTLPNLKWKEIKVKVRVSEGQVYLDSIQLGTPQDALYIQLRGSLSFSFLRNRFRIKDYDLQMQVEIDKNLRLGLLDLMLANTKTEIPKGYRYRARIRGEEPEAPLIEKLSVF